MRTRSLLLLLLVALLCAAPAAADLLCPAGHPNPDDALFCMKCGAQLVPGGGSPPPVAATQTTAEAPLVRPPDYETLYGGDAPAPPDAVVAPPSIGQKPILPAELFAGADGRDLLEPDPDFKVPTGVPTDGTLTRWFGSDPRGLNYICEAGADVNDCVYAYVAESLATRHTGNPDKWAPQLAERIQVAHEHTVYRITLRAGVKWHPAKVDYANPQYAWLACEHPVTTADVAFFLDLVRDPTVDTGGLGNYYEDLESYRIVDERTIILTWRRRVYHSIAATLSILPMPEFLYAYDEKGQRFPKATLGKNFNTHWYNNRAIGCGPYVFTDWTPGVAITLDRNENYWGDKPPIKRLQFLIYRDENQNILKLKAQEQDFAVLTATQYRDEVLHGRPVSPVTGEPLEVGVYQASSYFYIGWNNAKPPFDEKAVRQAMSFAFNRKELLENVFYNLGEVTESSIFKYSRYYNEKLIPRVFSLDTAARLLEAADWIDRDGDGVREKYVGLEKRLLDVELLIYADSTEWRTVAEVYRDDLRKIGIKLRIQPVDWALLQKRMDARDFDAYSGGWGLNWDPDPYQVWHSSQVGALGGSNKIGFRNAEADRILETLRVTFDPAERKRLLDRFQAILYEEQPVTFFYTRKYVALWWSYLKNVSFQKLSPHENSLPWYVIPH